MSEVKYAIAILKEKLGNADKHNLQYQRLSIADMEAIWGVLSKCESDYAELKAQRDALAAENVALRNAHPQPFGPIMMQGLDAYEKDREQEPETGMLNAFFILRDSINIQTPATDAYLSSVRAEGADKVAEYHFVRIDALKEVSRQGHLFHKAAYSDAVNVSNLLRTGKDG